MKNSLINHLNKVVASFNGMKILSFFSTPALDFIITQMGIGTIAAKIASIISLKMETMFFLIPLLISQHEVNRGKENSSTDLLESQQFTDVAGDKVHSSATKMSGTLRHEPASADLECLKNHQNEEDTRPPSEWLEDTLIDLFLAGYPGRTVCSTPDVVPPRESYDADALDFSAHGDAEIYELEEGEWIPEDDLIGSNDNNVDEGTSWEEENWKAQYGQVCQQNEASVAGLHVLDLWDWSIVPGTAKDGNGHEARLIGRRMKVSGKLHPSLPSGGTRLKTAPISEVHTDLVRVRSGQIYRLRRPSKHYLDSISYYDSSNPTSGWGFPGLSVSRDIHPPSELGRHNLHKEVVMSEKHINASNQEKSIAYRDRAAERRALHGGFGVGPGQKKADGNDSAPQVTTSPEDAAVESLNMSFGAGSYARKLLENMGWKEGEALGKTNKGLLEPLQALGNNGNAGLGWDVSKRKEFLSYGR